MIKEGILGQTKKRKTESKNQPDFPFSPELLNYILGWSKNYNIVCILCM